MKDSIFASHEKYIRQSFENESKSSVHNILEIKNREIMLGKKKLVPID